MKNSKCLFRFKRCNKYAFDELFKGYITFVCLDKFNDAMEGYIQFDPSVVYETCLKENYKSFFNKLIKNEEKTMIFGGKNPFSEMTKTEKYNFVRSEEYKPKAMAFIKEFGETLFNELRNSFCAASFSARGGHPVMWSHYSDDSSGFAIAYDVALLRSNFYAYATNEFEGFNKQQMKLFKLHKITYGESRDCTNLVIDFIKKAYNPGKTSINKFMKYAENGNNIDDIIYLLTNKMKEWEYECEYRLLIPRTMTKKKKILKEEALEYSVGIVNASFTNPEFIVAGEKIEKSNLAALAYYASINLKGIHKLWVQKRDKDLVEKHIMHSVRFDPKYLE